MRLILFSCFLGLTLFAHTQDTLTVEKSISGIQLGLYNAHFYKEIRLKSKLTLRGELGAESGFSWGSSHPFTLYVAPSIGLEPRYYYNFARRLKKAKPIRNNSANYLALSSVYLPWVFSSDSDYSQKINRVLISPYWGIRRPMGKHFNFEFGLGVIAPVVKEFSYSPYLRLRFGLNL